MDNPHDYLTVTQAAKLLGCSAQTLRAWDNRGFITASYKTLLGGHRRYYRKDIQALLDKRDQRHDQAHPPADPA